MMSPRLIWPYILVLVLCTVADWALTLDALAMGIAKEANPIMGRALEQGSGFALIYKLAWVVAGVILLQVLGKGSRLSVWGMRVLAGAYVSVVLYQCIARLFVM